MADGVVGYGLTEFLSPAAEFPFEVLGNGGRIAGICLEMDQVAAGTVGAHQTGVEQGAVSVFTGVAPHAEQVFAFDFFGGNELVGFGNVQTRYISRLRHGGRSQGQGERGGAK